jgi:hypothetical protein
MAAKAVSGVQAESAMLELAALEFSTAKQMVREA